MWCHSTSGDVIIFIVCCFFLQILWCKCWTNWDKIKVLQRKILIRIDLCKFLDFYLSDVTKKNSLNKIPWNIRMRQLANWRSRKYTSFVSVQCFSVNMFLINMFFYGNKWRPYKSHMLIFSKILQRIRKTVTSMNLVENFMHKIVFLLNSLSPKCL